MHVNVKPWSRGWTLVELLIVMTIIAILAVAAVVSTRDLFRKSSLTAQTVGLKGAVQKARLRAIERNATVRVTLTGGRFLALVDLDRGGVYGQDATGTTDPAELVYGNDITVGTDFDTSTVEWVTPSHPALGSIAIPHPSGAYDIQPGTGTGYSTFPNDTFFISPAGMIRDDNGTVTGGSLFMREIDDQMVTLVHISAVGEVRTAFKERVDTEWTWQ